MANRKAASPAGALYVQVCLSDHQRDVAGLSAEERGVYEALRVAYYQNGGPLPAEVHTLYRLTGAVTTRERKAVTAVLSMRFEKDEGGLWRNTTCDAELARIYERKQKRRAAAKCRWPDEETKPDAQADANAYANACPNGHAKAMLTINQEPETLDCSSTVLKNNNCTTLPSLSSLKEGEKGNKEVVVPAPPKNSVPMVGADKEQPDVLSLSSSTPRVDCSTPPCAQPSALADRVVVPTQGAANVPKNAAGELDLEERAGMLARVDAYQRARASGGYGPTKEEREQAQLSETIANGSLFAMVSLPQTSP